MPRNRFAKKPLATINENLGKKDKVAITAAITSTIASVLYLGFGGFGDIYELLTPENAGNIAKIAIATTAPIVGFSVVAASFIVGFRTADAAFDSFERAKIYKAKSARKNSDK